MDKKYLCFACYGYHPEMRGVSEDEFNNGNKICQEEKCVCKGQEFETAQYCEACEKMFRYETHKH